jgi:peptidoglycan/LPS O-acetylase OafA/YrhL
MNLSARIFQAAALTILVILALIGGQFIPSQWIEQGVWLIASLLAICGFTLLALGINLQHTHRRQS